MWKATKQERYNKGNKKGFLGPAAWCWFPSALNGLAELDLLPLWADDSRLRQSEPLKIITLKWNHISGFGDLSTHLCGLLQSESNEPEAKYICLMFLQLNGSDWGEKINSEIAVRNNSDIDGFFVLD